MKNPAVTGHAEQFKKLSRIVESGKIPQVFLFHGIPGIGKHLTARWFIRSLMCTGSPRPCGTCPACMQFRGGTHPDFIEISCNDKGIIPIGKSDEAGTVRWLISRLSRSSIKGRYGVIINGADRIPLQGQNALLKTLEEPPEGAVIVLLSSNRSLLLPTILSRSTEFPFKSLKVEEIREILKSHDMNPPHLDLLAAFSGGSYELAVMLTEEDNLLAVIAIMRSMLVGLQKGGMLNLEFDVILKRIGPDNLLFVLINALRCLLIIKFKNEELPPLLADLPGAKPEDIQKLIKVLMELQKKLILNVNLATMMKSFLYAMEKFPLVDFPDMPVDY